MALSTELVKRLMHAVTDQALGRELVDAINKGSAAGGQIVSALAGAIVATNVSQTVDFASLKVGDLVAMIPATAGSADFITVATIGDLGQAAVVGNLYLVIRPLVLDAASAVKL
jgi:hypothetical protein